MGILPLIRSVALVALVAASVAACGATNIGNGASATNIGNGSVPTCTDVSITVTCGPTWYPPAATLGPFVVTTASANQMSSDATSIFALGNPLNGSKGCILCGAYSAGVYQPGLNCLDFSTQTMGTAAQISSSLWSHRMWCNRPPASIASGVDAGFGLLQRMIEYKAESAGVTVVAVDPRFSSQECSKCGSCERGSRRRRRFACLQCGYFNHADVNAALVIRGRAQLALLRVPDAGADPVGLHDAA